MLVRPLFSVFLYYRTTIQSIPGIGKEILPDNRVMNIMNESESEGMDIPDSHGSNGITGSTGMKLADSTDVMMFKNDEEIMKEAMQQRPSDSLAVHARSQKFDESKSRLGALIGEENVYSFVDESLWQRIYEYIRDHLDEFLQNNSLGILLQIRYSFCFYIVAFLPAEVIVPIPAKYGFIIPASARKIEILRRALDRLKEFFAFVKKESKTSFLINFTLSRKGSVKEDIEFILQIPILLKNEPMKVLRWFLDYDLKAAGFS